MTKSSVTRSQGWSLCLWRSDPEWGGRFEASGDVSRSGFPKRRHDVPDRSYSNRPGNRGERRRTNVLRLWILMAYPTRRVNFRSTEYSGLLAPDRRPIQFPATSTGPLLPLLLLPPLPPSTAQPPAHHIITLTLRFHRGVAED